MGDGRGNTFGWVKGDFYLCAGDVTGAGIDCEGSGSLSRVRERVPVTMESPAGEGMSPSNTKFPYAQSPPLIPTAR